MFDTSIFKLPLNQMTVKYRDNYLVQTQQGHVWICLYQESDDTKGCEI